MAIWLSVILQEYCSQCFLWRGSEGRKLLLESFYWPLQASHCCFSVQIGRRLFLTRKMPKLVPWNPDIMKGQTCSSYNEVSLYRGLFPSILLLLEQNISFVIPRTSVYRCFLYRDSTVHNSKLSWQISATQWQ